MGNIVHSPFLYHLFICCGEDYKSFVTNISNEVENKIEELYRLVEKNAEKRKIEEDTWSTLPKNFRGFVQKMESWDKNKKPEYCLFEFYTQIAALKQNFTNSTKRCDVVLQSDIDIIKKFRSMYDVFYENGTDAINEKRLRDLVKKLKNGKALNRKQEDIFIFLLNEVFPHYGNERGYFLEIIRSKPWKELAFGDLMHQEIVRSTMQEDDRYEEIEKAFNILYKVSPENTDEIKKRLVKISNLLDQVYENYFCNEIHQDVMRNNSTEHDFCGERRDSQLHSHILAFMRWIPMVRQGERDEKMMESVDNVIDKIESQVCEIVADNDSLKQRLSTYPTSDHESIFLQTDGIKLRELLVDAMYHEKHINLLFQRFYGVVAFQMEEKGGI